LVIKQFGYITEAFSEHFCIKTGDNSLIISVSAPFAPFFVKSIFEKKNLKKVLGKNRENGARVLVISELSYRMFPKNGEKMER
jgi:hypothetical protein